MEITDNKISTDIENLLNVIRPKLINAYANGDAASYHKISVESIPIAHRVFMHLRGNSDTSWSLAKSYGPLLSTPSFWLYTDFVQSFCDHLKKRLLLKREKKICIISSKRKVTFKIQ